MEKLNLPKEFVFEFIQNLFEEKTFYARAKKSGKIVIFKNKDEWKQKIKSGSHKPVDSDEAEKEMGKKEKEPEGEPEAEKKPEGEPEGAPPPTPKVMNIDKHQFKGDNDEKEDNEDIGVGEQRTHLRNVDHQTTDKQLNFTKIEAKAQAEKKGKKGVGAGTAESRAGEAAVVNCPLT